MFRRLHRPLVGVALAALTVALAAAGSLGARQDPAPKLPAARVLVDRSVDAIGGAAAFRSVSAIHATGTFEMPAQGITGTIEVFSSRPSNVRVRAEIDGVGRIERGYDGKIGWSIDPVAGPALVTGRQLRELLDDALFDGPLHPADKIREMTAVEATTFDGQAAYKVHVIFTSGTEQFEYYATESGLLIGSEGSREVPGGGVIPRVNIYRDYKQFGVLRQPTKLVQQTLGLEQVLTIVTYDYAALPPDAFRPPPEVLALIRIP